MDVAGVIGVARHLARWMERELNAPMALSDRCGARRRALLLRKEQLLLRASELHNMNEAYAAGQPVEYARIKETSAGLEAETESLRNAWKQFNEECRTP